MQTWTPLEEVEKRDKDRSAVDTVLGATLIRSGDQPLFGNLLALAEQQSNTSATSLLSLGPTTS
jgi:hypothetical protein